MNDPRIIDFRAHRAVRLLKDWSDQNDCRIAAVLNERRPLPDYPVDPVELLRKSQIERHREKVLKRQETVSALCLLTAVASAVYFIAELARVLLP